MTAVGGSAAKAAQFIVAIESDGALRRPAAFYAARSCIRSYFAFYYNTNRRIKQCRKIFTLPKVE